MWRIMSGSQWGGLCQVEVWRVSFEICLSHTPLELFRLDGDSLNFKDSPLVSLWNDQLYKFFILLGQVQCKNFDLSVQSCETRDVLFYIINPHIVCFIVSNSLETGKVQPLKIKNPISGQHYYLSCNKITPMK